MMFNESSWLNQRFNSKKSSGLAGRLPARSSEERIAQRGLVEMSFSQAISARIVPLDEQGKPGPESQVELNSCDRRGITFKHKLPMSARRALVTVEDEIFGPLEAEVNLSWCRFHRMGHYSSGGRFVQPAGRIA